MNFNLVFIVMEYVPGGSLWDLTQRMGAMGEEAGRFFLKQILDAIDHLHNQRQIVHRDLKPQNILVDQNLNVKVADFGSATDKNIESLLTLAGTEQYAAPEVL